MEKKDKPKPDYNILLKSVGEASQMSISFVFFPVILLLLGVWLDKKFDTLPLFIVIGIVTGIIIFVFQVRITIKKISKGK